MGKKEKGMRRAAAKKLGELEEFNELIKHTKSEWELSVDEE